MPLWQYLKKNKKSHPYDTIKRQTEALVWMQFSSRWRWRETELRLLERQNSSWFRYILYITFTYDIHFDADCGKMCAMHHVLLCMTCMHHPIVFRYALCSPTKGIAYAMSHTHGISHAWYERIFKGVTILLFVSCVLSLILLYLYTRFSSN